MLKHRTRDDKRRFQLILIKPSHYDDDGYVVQWLRSTMPSNSLAAVYSLALGRRRAAAARARSSHRRHAPWTRPIPASARARSCAASPTTAGSGWSASSACSRTNSLAPSISRGRLRAAGIQVMIGGFHVSGLPLDAQGASRRHQGRRRSSAFRSYAGEAEEGLDEVLIDAARGELRAALRSHEASAGHRRHRLPALPAARLRRSAPSAM